MIFPVVVLWYELLTFNLEPIPVDLWHGEHLSCFPVVHSVIDGVTSSLECALLLLWHPLFSHVMLAFDMFALLLVCSNITFEVNPFWWHV